MGPAGAGSLAQVVNAALRNKTRFDAMREFFSDVGAGDNSGVWEDTPRAKPEFRERYRKQMDALAKKRSAGDTSDFKTARMI
jgi:chlorophyllide a reductase subunit Y